MAQILPLETNWERGSRINLDNNIFIDGDDQDNNRINLPNPLLNTPTNWAMSFFISTRYVTNNRIFSIRDGGGGGFYMAVTGTNIEIIRLGDSVNKNLVSYEENVQMHVVLNYDTTNGIMTTYINGEFNDQVTHNTPAILDDEYFRLYDTGGTRPSHCTYAHFITFNRQLSVTEIQFIFNNGGILPETTHEYCVAHWPLNGFDNLINLNDVFGDDLLMWWDWTGNGDAEATDLSGNELDLGVHGTSGYNPSPNVTKISGRYSLTPNGPRSGLEVNLDGVSKEITDTVSFVAVINVFTNTTSNNSGIIYSFDDYLNGGRGFNCGYSANVWDVEASTNPPVRIQAPSMDTINAVDVAPRCAINIHGTGHSNRPVKTYVNGVLDGTLNTELTDVFKTINDIYIFFRDDTFDGNTNSVHDIYELFVVDGDITQHQNYKLMLDGYLKKKYPQIDWGYTPGNSDITLTDHKVIFKDIVQQYNYSKPEYSVGALSTWTLSAGMSVTSEQLSYDGLEAGLRSATDDINNLSTLDIGKYVTVKFNVVSNSGYFYVGVGGSSANQYRLAVSGTGEKEYTLYYESGSAKMLFVNGRTDDTSQIGETWTLDNVEVLSKINNADGYAISYDDEKIEEADLNTPQNVIQNIRTKQSLPTAAIKSPVGAYHIWMENSNTLIPSGNSFSFLTEYIIVDDTAGNVIGGIGNYAGGGIALEHDRIRNRNGMDTDHLFDTTIQKQKGLKIRYAMSYDSTNDNVIVYQGTEQNWIKNSFTFLHQWSCSNNVTVGQTRPRR